MLAPDPLLNVGEMNTDGVRIDSARYWAALNPGRRLPAQSLAPMSGGPTELPELESGPM